MREDAKPVKEEEAKSAKEEESAFFDNIKEIQETEGYDTLQ
jgi:hypothetical protein